MDVKVLNPGWFLAIDTSTEQASVALLNKEHVAEISWPAGRDQTVSVLDQIDHLLTLTKITLGDLAAIAVATGPGMFSGLRVGMSVAKGLAYSADLPLIGVGTFEALVLPFAECDEPVVAVLKAGRGRLLWSTCLPNSWTEPRNGTAEELRQEVGEHGTSVLVCGELSLEHKEEIRKAPNAVIPPSSLGLKRASQVAEIARNRFSIGEIDDPVELEPTYIHAVSPTRK